MLAIQQQIAVTADWQEVTLKANVLPIVARVSSRIFTGPQLCRDSAWLRLTSDYTTQAVRAVYAMRVWPAPLRPIVHWFLPACCRLRADVHEARRVINEVLRERGKAQSAWEESYKHHDDALAWFERQAKGRPYDASLAQMVLAFVSAHTTTDLLTQVLIDVSQHEYIVQPLRDEIREATERHGITAVALQAMGLLDSVIKESQRLKPISIASMRRVAKSDIRLSDGTFISQGSSLMVLSDRHWDEELYHRAQEWDGYRFLRRAQTASDQAGAANLVATSPEHLGFGYGLHACPGRFLAAHMIKIVMIHLLQNYDWRLSQGQKPRIRKTGIFLDSDSNVKMEFRRRKT